MYKKILHANDGSEGAFKALAAALNLAKRYRTELHMVCVEETQWIPGSREEVIGEQTLENRKYEEVIARATAEAKKQRIKLHPHVLLGHPVKAIGEFVAQNKFDLLVVGFVGHSALYLMLGGSTAERLVHTAPCTVVVVK